LKSYDELWIIPCENKFQSATIEAIKAYVKSGKGIWIFGGNYNEPSN
jgi:uncharacterized membrane protein